MQMSGQSLRVIKGEGNKVGQIQFLSGSLEKDPLQEDLGPSLTACTLHSLPHQSDLFSSVRLSAGNGFCIRFFLSHSSFWQSTFPTIF